MALTRRASLGSNPWTPPRTQAPHRDPNVFPTPNGVATPGLRTAALHTMIMIQIGRMSRSEAPNYAIRFHFTSDIVLTYRKTNPCTVVRNVDSHPKIGCHKLGSAARGEPPGGYCYRIIAVPLRRRFAAAKYQAVERKTVKGTPGKKRREAGAVTSSCPEI